MKHATFLFVSRLFLLGFLSGGALPLLAEEPTEDTDRFSSAIYHGIGESDVQLTEGRWEGPPHVEGGASGPSLGLVDDFVIRGDLDGDGVDEAVVLLWQSSGGSGTFDYLAVMDEDDGEWTNLATAPLGDRVQVRRGVIANGGVYLDVIQQGESDAACCPGQWVRRSWVLDEEGLAELDSEYIDILSASVISGEVWRLVEIDGQPVPEGVTVSLEVKDGRVFGNSGCNQYSAGIENGAVPGEIHIGPTMGTRMACPDEQMNVETEFLQALASVNRFQFQAGKLILSGMADGEPVSLKFETGFANGQPESHT